MKVDSFINSFAGGHRFLGPALTYSEVTRKIEDDIRAIILPIRGMPYYDGPVRGATMSEGYLREAIRPCGDGLGRPARIKEEYPDCEIRVVWKMN